MGVRGGILSLALLLAIIYACFHAIGRSVEAPRRCRADKLLLWAIGASLFSHVVSFMGVSYWDQIVVLWYGTLAVTSATAVPSLRAAHVRYRLRGRYGSSPAPVKGLEPSPSPIR
jgi:hypothetical protein